VHAAAHADPASDAYTLWAKVVSNYHVVTSDMCMTDMTAGAIGGSDKVYGAQWVRLVDELDS
jgi:hypothetical protein